jgi:hypothetical protein
LLCSEPHIFTALLSVIRLSVAARESQRNRTPVSRLIPKQKMKKAQVQKATENVWVLTTADKQVPYFIKYSVQLRTLILQ